MTQSVSTAKAPAAEDEVLDKMANHHIRIAVVGNVDAGKSTLIGSLVTGVLDDGRGGSRALIMKHKHELESGRTSTIQSHLLGLDENANTIISSSEAEKAMKATRLVTLMDLAGHEKYLKTTIQGIARGVADYALVLVNASQPPGHMTKHHLSLCFSVGIPVIIVMTKADRCPSGVFRATKRELQTMVNTETGVRAYDIRSKTDIDIVKDKLVNRALAPIISVSCLTGEGIDTLKAMFMELPQRRRLAKKQRNKQFEYLIEDVFQVPGVGTVVSGLVTRGQWKKGETLYIGPLKNGSILTTTPKSVHVAQTNVDHVYAGHSVCFALPKITRDKRKLFTKGMVALKESFVPTRNITCEIMLLDGKNTTIQKGRYQATLNILHQKVVARVVGVSDENGNTIDIVRNNDNKYQKGAVVSIAFKLTHKPCFVRKGMKVIMRDGHVRGIGVISSVVELKKKYV